jgi:hypothetical protein
MLTGLPPIEEDFSQPLPLDLASRTEAFEASTENSDESLMKEHGADIVEQLLNMPKGYDVVEGQHDRWSRAAPGHETWAEQAKTCTDFFEGNQWTEAEINTLKEEGRPKVTKNKIRPIMRLLMGYFAQHRYDIKALPGNDGTGSGDIADLLTATFKQIAEQNNTDWNDAQVFQDGLIAGRGFWDIRLDFTRNRLGEAKEIVLDPFNVYIDPEADSYDPNGTGGQSSWKYVMANKWMSIIDIFRLYGNLPAAEVGLNVPSVPIGNDGYRGAKAYDISPSRWFGLENYLYEEFEAGLRGGGNVFDHLNRQRKLFRVLDCQHRHLKKVNFFVDLATGAEKIIPDGTPREKIQRVLEYSKLRNIPVDVGTDYKEVIRWTVTAGDRVLFDKWSPYDGYTIVPYFPYFRRGKTQSPIEDLLDPQREINKRAAAFLHIIMSTANSGWVWEKGALSDEMRETLEQQGARPGLHIEYETGANAPQRIAPQVAPMAIRQLEDDATRDLKEISSVNDSALGQLDKVQSGIAVQARQQQAVIGAETYYDNFARSRELKGGRYLEIVQDYYSEPRLVRIRHGNGTTEDKMINTRNAAGMVENNVTMGRYMIAVDKTPVSATFQQAQFEDAKALVGLGVPVPPDILVDMSAVSNKDEIKQRLAEARETEMNNQAIQNLATRAQAGLPLDQPLPPIVVGNKKIVNVDELGGGGSPAQTGGGTLLPDGAAPAEPPAPPPDGGAEPSAGFSTVTTPPSGGSQRIITTPDGRRIIVPDNRR